MGTPAKTKSFILVGSAAIFQIVVAGVIGAIVLKTGFSDPADEESEPRPGLTKPRPERIVQFPEDQSVGELSVRNWGSGAGRLYEPKWEEIGEARGPVSIPAGREVSLNVSSRSHLDLEFLTQLGPDDIQQLKVSSHLVSEGTITHLAGLSSLHRLLFLNAQWITDQELAGLSHLTELRRLDLWWCGRVTDRGVAQLANMTELEELVLVGASITDEALVYVAGHSSLRVLWLSETSITSGGLRHLRDLTSMERLYLRNTHLTDAGLSELEGMTSLRVLELSGTRITDAGLRHLKGLTSLTRVSLLNTYVTERGVAKLRKALPKCKIEHSPAAPLLRPPPELLPVV